MADCHNREDGRYIVDIAAIHITDACSIRLKSSFQRVLIAPIENKR
jgi:hypothetical protein